MLKPVRANYSAGIWIAFTIIVCWFVMLWYSLQIPFSLRNPLCWILFLGLTHLYTGLFITAHDAMHGTVSLHKRLNNAIGLLCGLLFAFNWLPRLKHKHQLHHTQVATAQDPDYYHGSFWVWYLNFLKNYITLWQVILMGATFNLLMIWFSKINVVFYWMIPAILSTLQLFYFGTYLPHKGIHADDNPHKSRSQHKNHLWAFISCYFFGYHYEHHDAPYVPWWQLYHQKDKNV
jgi:beta-carotene/zeaxanthin 4-ketolase